MARGVAERVRGLSSRGAIPLLRASA